MSNYHRVQAGERLSEIAALHGVAYQDIVAANPSKPLARLQSGEIVFAALAEGEEIALPGYLGAFRGGDLKTDRWHGHPPPHCRPGSAPLVKSSSSPGYEVVSSEGENWWIDQDDHVWVQVLNDAPVDKGLFQSWNVKCVSRGAGHVSPFSGNGPHAFG